MLLMVERGEIVHELIEVRTVMFEKGFDGRLMIREHGQSAR